MATATYFNLNQQDGRGKEIRYPTETTTTRNKINHSLIGEGDQPQRLRELYPHFPHRPPLPLTKMTNPPMYTDPRGYVYKVQPSQRRLQKSQKFTSTRHARSFSSYDRRSPPPSSTELGLTGTDEAFASPWFCFFRYRPSPIGLPSCEMTEIDPASWMMIFMILPWFIFLMILRTRYTTSWVQFICGIIRPCVFVQP